MTTEKSLVAEAENSQHQQQKEEGEGATNSGQQGQPAGKQTYVGDTQKSLLHLCPQILHKDILYCPD